MEELDLPKLITLFGGAYAAVTTTLHPLNVIKVRVQAQHQGGVTQLDAARSLWQTAGWRGFFAGLGPRLVSILPAEVAYIGSLESVKASAHTLARKAGFGKVEAAALASGAGGCSAVFASQLINVPVDVVSQRQMVAGDAALRGSAMQVAREIVQSGGVLGLYRGLGLTLAMQLPGGFFWWSAYGAAKVRSDPWRLPILLQQAVAASCAAATTVLLTGPLDTLKVRIQVADASRPPPSVLAAVAILAERDGLLSLWRGAGLRWIHLTFWGGSIVTVYEALKSLCVRSPATPSASLLHGKQHRHRPSAAKNLGL